MSDTDWVDLGEITEEVLLASKNGAENEADTDPVIFETLRDFLERELPPNESLVGVTRDGTNLLPRYGWVLPWGREGSGKTSILVDLLFHACSGLDWLGYSVTRAIRIVAIVNEGVPGGLQDKLRQKVERWEHNTAVLDNLAIYASPWGEFTFRNEQIVQHAQDYARDFEADYVAFDPLHTLGTSGAGAPVETEEFKNRLRQFGMWDWLGVITAHHSNKAGMLSGDWGRHADTLLHLEKDGKRPSTKFTVEKARPADPAELNVPFLLDWEIETLSYTRVQIVEASSFDEVAAFEKAIEVLTRADKPLGKEAFVKAVGGTAEHVRTALDSWLKDGKIVDLTPEKRAFKLVLPSSVGTEPTQPDVTGSTAEESRMVDPHSYVGQTPTQHDETQNPPEGSSYVGVGLPVGETTQADVTERDKDDDIPLD